MNKKVLIVIAIIVVIAVVVAVYVATQNSGDKTNPEAQNATGEVQDEGFKVSYLGVDVTPGTPFNRNDIPEEGTYSEIPSCAFEGTDNVATFSHAEITSAQVNGVETVYSVYFLDTEIKTEEGVAISDDRAKVIEAYGENFEENGNKITYTKGNVELSFLIENDIVTSIEYVLVVE